MLYVPAHFKVENQKKIIDFINQYSFATLISVKENQVAFLSKIPLLLKKMGEQIYLEGHLAKTNPHWKYLEIDSSLIIMFDGPHDYVSPTLCSEPIRNVPTWNYTTVIAQGCAEMIDSSDWLIKSVMELADKYEKDDSWKNNVDRDFIKNLSKGIVGIKILVSSFEGKFKLSQNRDEISRLKMINNFEISNPDLAKEMNKN